MNLDAIDRLKLLFVGGAVFACAYRCDPSSGPVLVALGYLLLVVLMVTAPDPRGPR